MTTVNVAIDRNIKETTQIGVSGIDSTAATLDVTHELLRNIILDMNAGLTNDDYNGGTGLAANREDNLFKGDAGVEYLFNRNFTLTAGYDFTHRASQGSVNGDYTKHAIFFRVGAAL